MGISNDSNIWFAAGVRTPFAKVDGPLKAFDAIGLSVPVVRHMIDHLHGARPTLRYGALSCRTSPGATSPAKY